MAESKTAEIKTAKETAEMKTAKTVKSTKEYGGNKDA